MKKPIFSFFELTCRNVVKKKELSLLHCTVGTTEARASSRETDHCGRQRHGSRAGGGYAGAAPASSGGGGNMATTSGGTITVANVSELYSPADNHI